MRKAALFYKEDNHDTIFTEQYFEYICFIIYLIYISDIRVYFKNTCSALAYR